MRTRNESRHRPNRSGWLVTQRLEDWMEMHKNSHIKKEK